MDDSTRTRLQELSRRPGIDAVVYKEVGRDPIFHFHFGPAEVTEIEKARFEPLSGALLELAKHLPEPTAIVGIGKYNVRIHTGPDLTVLVFLECGHSTAKSLLRTLRRVVNGTKRPRSSPRISPLGDQA
jgi:hypothetical protein